MKILIIDDDMMFRKYMEKIITGHYGEQLELEFAVNGAHGLEMIEEVKPHIVLTDISMPEMNGLEFIKASVNNGFDGIIAVLSSYDDFGYVKETLTQGAVDYVLKHEAKKEDIFELIESCKVKYNEKELKKIKALQIEKSHDEAVALELLRACYIQREEEHLIETLMNSRFENLYYRPYYIIVNEKRSLDYGTDLEGITVKDEYSKYDNYIHLVWEIKNKTEAGYQETIREAIRCNGLSHGMVGVSLLKYDMSKVGEAYEEAMDIYFYKLRTYKGSCYGNEMDFEDLEEYNNQLLEITRSLKQTLDAGKCNRYLEKVNDFLKKVKRSKIRRRNFYDIHRESYYQLLNYIEPKNRKEVNGLELLDFRNENLLELSDKVYKWYEEIIGKLCIEHNDKRSSELTNQIKDYIKNNIYKNVQLHNIAIELGYSDNHLSKQFKIDTGYRIKEYINIIKIEKAKEVIKTGEYKVYEVAEMFGFGSTAYFCSVFKNITGETVKSYSKK